MTSSSPSPSVCVPLSLDKFSFSPSHWSSLCAKVPSMPAPSVGPSYVKNRSGFLTEEQVQFYDLNGFLLVKSLIPPEDITRYTQRFKDIAEGKALDAPKSMLKMRDIAVAKKKEDGERAITKLQDWQEDDILFDYCRHPNILPFVKEIIGEDIRSVHTMVINKPSDVGLGSSRHPPHQDLWYFPFRPADFIVASWTAMQRIDESNGCLFVAPGTHRMGRVFKHEYPNDGIVNKAYHGIQTLSGESSSSSMYHVKMDIGDTLFFHPLLIHGSGRNLSDGFRKAISCHYAASSCTFIDVSNTLQQEIADEVIEMAKKRGRMGHVNWVSIWQKKSRIIAGEKNTEKFDAEYSFKPQAKL